MAITLVALAWLSNAASARAGIPDGFSIIDVRSGPEFHANVGINDCGDIVIGVGRPWEPSSEIYYYDRNGLQRVTDNDVPDGFPDINNEGVMVWSRNWDGGVESTGEILRSIDGEVNILGDGAEPRINGNGQVVWSRTDYTECFGATVFLYDPHVGTRLLYQDGQANYTPQINDSGMVVWTSYQFCTDGEWESRLLGFSDGQIVEFDDESGTQSQGIDVSHKGQAVWGSNIGALKVIMSTVENGVSTLIEGGYRPRITSAGEILFYNYESDVGANQAWLYRPNDDPPLIRIVEEPLDNGRGEINEYGECVLPYSLLPQSFAGGVRYLRRNHVGDVNVDGIVNLADFTYVSTCMNGPDGSEDLCECRFLDLQYDGDVDLRDLAGWQLRFGLSDMGRDYCHAHESAGANDEAVASCVCEVFPYCCNTSWDEFCVEAVDWLPCGRCP